MSMSTRRSATTSFVDAPQLLNDVANIRNHATFFVAALEHYFDRALRLETGHLDRPTAVVVNGKTPTQLVYALGLREGLTRGRMILDVLEQVARAAMAEAGGAPGPQPQTSPPPAQSQSSEAQRYDVATRQPPGIRSTAPTPGIRPLPEWVSVDGRTG